MKRYLLYLFLMVPLLGAGFGQQQATAPAGAHAVAAQTPSAESIWADLMEGNQRFVMGKTETIDVVALRQSLVKGQQPKVVVLACSDSRVSPEILFDKNLGELFVVRSAGNVADAIGVGSIEYSVEHLGSSVLVVLGHEKCGAVTAACSGDKMPTANLQAIVDKISPAVTRARTHAKGDELVEAAILDNVRQSAKDVVASSEVLQHFLHDGKLTVFEAVYRLDSGKVEQLGKISGHD
ncbi:MAG: carbonic anhydrase [Terriglobales bacterium]|jgi:carbonic anhydrase